MCIVCGGWINTEKKSAWKSFFGKWTTESIEYLKPMHPNICLLRSSQFFLHFSCFSFSFLFEFYWYVQLCWNKLNTYYYFFYINKWYILFIFVLCAAFSGWEKPMLCFYAVLITHKWNKFTQCTSFWGNYVNIIRQLSAGTQ